MATSKQKMENQKGGMKTPPVVSQQEWQVARQQLLVKEKALTRSRDALAAERRRMPWMAVEKKYEFDGPKGKVSLLDLFEGRRQLIVYRAFFEPGVCDWPERACRRCSRGAEHSGFEEGAIDDQLTAALEQIEQAYLALGSVELVLLLHRHPRHPSTLGGQRVTGAGQGLLLHEELLARNLPLLLRHDRRCFHSAFLVLHFLLACCHIISPLFSCR